MTKLTFAALALVAAAAYSAQASAANNNAAARRAHASMMTTTTPVNSKTTDCVRAPNVGSFATAPFTEPPCMPGTMR
ncbi:hypothetical protein CK489_34905 [Bradyrhizobium sp. UFLA03-84]|uniref:hypothetical protein n=1 Tax=Bradyrhizobium sp. UFLA03-84 TaxID=418599 RepID=UPI000BAE0C97|nr:hypothetical protein [Bradyrhizobium sp. UFLA03-84]PAY04425.1 hypothetical protein CK489_34905 [Bradyrhizobium sp. UFLA03-84]